MKVPIKRRRWGESELTLIDSVEPRDLFARARAALKDLDSESRSHLASCVCPACLYELYKGSKKNPGRPWSKKLFFIGWLIHEAKVDHLIKKRHVEKKRFGAEVTIFIEKGPTQELNRFGSVKLLIYRVRDYDRSPAWKTVTGFLKLCDANLIDLLPAYSQRAKSDAFAKVLKSVMEKKLALLRTEHERIGPPLSGYQSSKGLKLATKIRDFVLTRRGKKATRREIQRKFNISGAEVDEAADWLEGLAIYRQEIAHKLQRKRGGYRNKQTVIYAFEKPVPRRPDRK
jgi:hypothetical protein